MIEVGHPFSRPFEGLVDSLVTSLQLGVEQPDTQELLFRTGTFAYPLRDAGTVSGLAAQITGFVAKKPAIFTREVHYVYAVGQLVWQRLPEPADPDVAAAWFPDDNSRLTVGYFYRDLPSGITDFNEEASPERCCARWRANSSSSTSRWIRPTGAHSSTTRKASRSTTWSRCSAFRAISRCRRKAR